MSDKEAAIRIHNTARAQAQGGPRPALIWDDNLAAHAQAWANENAQTQSMHHSDGSVRPGEGENLAAGMPSCTFQSGSQMWVDEVKNYHGEPIGQGNFSSYGHYTQVIWPETTHFGMASAKGSNGWTYVVGRYSPAGNFTGKSAYRPGPSGPGASPSQPRPQGGGNEGGHNNSGAKDGIYLVNSEKDGKWTSGMAYYCNINPGHNDGQQPDIYIDVSKDHSITWENTSITGTFPDKVQFVSNVGGNGQHVGDGQVVGSGHNNYRGMTIYKDKQRVLYQVDGWKVYTIYYCK